MSTGISEPAVIVDCFISDLARVEPLGDGLYRLIFTVKQRSLYDEGHVESAVVAKLIASERTMKAMQMAMLAQQGQPDGTVAEDRARSGRQH